LANQWNQSIILEKFLKVVEEKAVENGTFTEDLKEWVEWAKQKAEWFNPLIQREDSILSDEDRQDILEK
jgi:hypothetical protein